MLERLLRFATLSAARGWLHHPVSHRLVDYYSQLRQQHGGLPVKSAIDPIQLKPCLQHMVVMDCDTPSDPHYRLAGESYIQLLGTNPTGRRYLDFVPKERHASASAAYVTCMAHGCGMLTRLITTNRYGHEIACEVVNLPVGDDADPERPRYLYVTLVPQGDAGWDMQEAGFSQYREVRERVFVDLGSGVPHDFVERPVEEAAG
ncbi:MAG: PAS domain-containing protein [Ferrovibrio sp.]